MMSIYPLKTISQKSGKINRFLGTSPKSIKEAEKLSKKPWLTSSILKSIEIKNRLHKTMCCTKDPLHKEEIAIKVKNYRNTILKLKQKSKTNHFNK